MRVVHVLPHARALGGTERTVLDLLESPALAHLEQRVAFVQPGRVCGFAPASVLGARTGRLVPGAAVPAIVRWRPDVIHGWLLQGNVLAATLKPLVPRAVLICSERHSHETLEGVRSLLERLVARVEDVAVGNSVAVRDAVVGRIPRRAERFRIIGPGVAAPVAAWAAAPTTAVMVGRIHPVKDHATALRAWRRIVDRDPSATLTIVGGGPGLSALQHQARALCIESAVRFCGQTDPAPFLASARLFLSTSRAEGFSRAVLEALATGLPVVSTAVGGMSEVRGDAVLVAPVGDDAAIAAHVLGWLGAPAELAAAGLAARVVAERFAPARSHEAYARLYAELAGGTVPATC